MDEIIKKLTEYRQKEIENGGYIDVITFALKLLESNGEYINSNLDSLEFISKKLWDFN